MDKKYVYNIIKEYSPKEPESKLDELKRLDRKVKNPAYIFAFTFGIIGALILGVGMCLAMEIIGSGTTSIVFGVIIGLIGIAMVSINYPLFIKILSSRKNKYADEIIERSNELLKD